MYRLLIRIGDEFCPVNYERARLAEGPIQATLFTEYEKEKACKEISQVLQSSEYIFELVLHTVRQ